MAKATAKTENGTKMTEEQRRGEEVLSENPSAPREEHPSAPPGGSVGGGVAERPSGALAALPDFAGDAGRGMEGATQESFAIPFLSILQKGSPQVDEASGVSVEGARQGMFFENVTGRMYDGKTGVVLVPCAYRRVFLRWGPKGSPGSGFKGELLPEEVANLRAAGKLVEVDRKLLFPLPDGELNVAKCDRVADVRNHYCLLLDEATGGWTQVLVSLTSTQIKKSKMLMSMLANVKLNGAAGQYVPATWANRIRATTIPESNEKGSWMGVRFELIGQVTSAALYAAGRAFNESVRAGTVEVKYEDQPEDPTTVDAETPGRAGGTF
jgi:hypothetical protein